eukprot:6561136-Heterocapsa_arctica.AAC.1
MARNLFITQMQTAPRRRLRLTKNTDVGTTGAASSSSASSASSADSTSSAASLRSGFRMKEPPICGIIEHRPPEDGGTGSPSQACNQCQARYRWHMARV